jgi:hypothetical protein
MNVQHLQVNQGEDRTLTMEARDSSNVPKDLTDRTVTWRVGRSPFRLDNPRALFSKTATTVDADAGSYSVSLQSTDLNLMPGDYEHLGILVDGGELLFVNDDDGLLQFVNNDDGELHFDNEFSGPEVVTHGRFRILDSIGG